MKLAMAAANVVESGVSLCCRRYMDPVEEFLVSNFVDSLRLC